MIFSVSRRSIINNGPARLDKSRYFAQPRPIILNCIHTDGLYIKVFFLSNMIVISHMIVILHGLITIIPISYTFVKLMSIFRPEA